jgi:serine/threonine protein kinase
MVHVLDAVRFRAPTPPRQLRPEVPRDIESICLHCLEKEPGKRYRTAQELADDLERFLNGKPIHIRPTGFWARIAAWFGS